MKILLVSYSDAQGGAAKALSRIAGHLSASGHSCRMLVASKIGESSSVIGPGRFGRVSQRLRSLLARAVIYLSTGSRDADRSLGLFPGGLAKTINASDADVVVLGWVGNEAISIREIGEINKPLVWRFSDQWPLAGTEHFLSPDRFARYTQAQTAATALARDLDARVHRHKLRAWQRPISVIAPSRWLAGCVASSAVARRWPVNHIPTPVDAALFCPGNRSQIRKQLGLPDDIRLIGFSALGATSDPRKGWDLLDEALARIKSRNVACIAIGGTVPTSRSFSLPLLDFGVVNDDAQLASIYAAIDVMVIPSRIDNLPQVGIESQACGCPVVAFDASGMRDLVEDGVSGALATPFSVESLASKVDWVLSDSVRHQNLSSAARARALANWAPGVVIPAYLDVLRNACKAWHRAEGGDR